LKVIEERFRAIEAADKLLREQNKSHFEILNNEGRRITAMTDKTVSQDKWDGFIKQYEERHLKLEKAIDGTVLKSEFQDYKASTERALTLKVGQTQGIGQVGTIVLGFFVILSSLASVAALLIALFRH
jgi:hypothetical protein